MTSLDTQLWELIANHDMPADASGRTFTKQLMDEHDLSLETAGVAIGEYRKFMYLCATRAERNVPSQAVDLVWHLHMQHSRDYWDVFCRKLGKPVHHTPGVASKGHLDDYQATVDAYKALFGRPPKGIWRQRTGLLAGVFGLLFMVPFVAVGVATLTSGGLATLFGFVWLFAVGTMIVELLKGMTTKGEFELIFETSDPFADDDAGDCGSGDCGGCGD